MIAIDTNVLVRLLTGDDTTQSEQAHAIVAHAEAAGVAVHLDDLVLAETAWVLRTTFGVDKADIVAALTGLLEAKAFAFTDRDLVASAVEAFARTASGFSDCLIVARNTAAGCSDTLTFDLGMRPLAGARIIRKNQKTP